MADLSISISNSLNCFGGAPTNKWNAFEWGDFLWGEGTADMLQMVVKVLPGDALSLTGAVTAKSLTHRLAETLQPSGDMTSELLSDGAGYTYLSPDRAADGEARDPVDWTEAQDQQAGWTEGAEPSTDWTEG